MAILGFSDLRAAAQAGERRTVVVVGAQQSTVLQAANEAKVRGLAEIILVGDEPAIQDVASAEGIDLSAMEIVHEPDLIAAARRAMILVTEGRAHVAMKGKVDSATFLRAALDKELGLRGSGLLTHVAVFEVKILGRMLLISDAGVVVAPTLEQKADIIRNAVYVAHKLGIELPKVAVLASNEMVNPKMPANIEAAALAKMADRGQITGALIDGPLALDNAISPGAAQIKGISSPVAGYADILIPPDIEAGNLMAKAIIYFGGCTMAGVVVGAQVPLILPSRSDPPEAKLDSLALGVVMTL
ncbi:MAG: bifunctional enoyl-CoA hydratase/phosphate acetyltransferase [Anaerolineae bacterium]|nr:bifunctional enoyl-CoA hydratase/phosphate acetyltransferase [Anaerolineae bacterium]